MLKRFAGWTREVAARRPFSSGLALGFLLLLVAFGAAGRASARESAAATLDARIARILGRGPLAGATVGIYVEHGADGRVVYAHGADRLLIPASNLKILTALATLERFGPAHRFHTRIWSPEAIDSDGYVPELIVEGGGDPAMNSEDWWRLAADLRRSGLRGVHGDIRVDDSLFDGPAWHPSWGSVTARAYHAPIGALTANYGTYFVSIWPRSTVGSSVLVDIDPPVPYLHLRNRARTASSKARPRLSVDRVAGRRTDGSPEEVVRVDGVARQGDAVDRFPRSVLDPGLYAGSVLAYQLRANGIEVGGGVRRAPRGEGDDELILDRPGRTVAEAVSLCLKYSNNSIAEILIKDLAVWDGVALDAEPARQGNWVAGIRAMRKELGKLGLDLGRARIVDGSGLSIQNRVTPRMLGQALRVGRVSFRSGPEFVAALPIARTDGTLEKRLQGGEGRIRAKTGLLSDASVTSLSGYAERSDGDVLIFSILVNGHAGGSGAAMDAVDEIARVLLSGRIDESGG
ncbi:MAG TPA: D-alanyl-D-alanine carboxypeptidase/D-alanyl-D-alanine-endopeptidase, partial [Deltaproteobacteria bacterium]|nr:D-alanyl-D-alanine carboxypeptidase/D-alanyl-D-alanine-endopeptidase [Deltaproteobacteria bacterium]